MTHTQHLPAKARWISALIITCLALVSMGLVAIHPASAMPAVEEAVLWTSQADYPPESVVDIHGEGFIPGTWYNIPVIRPDGSVVLGDGSFLPGWDRVQADAEGNFLYLYQLDGIQGVYQALAYNDLWAGDLSLAPVASTTFTDAGLVLVKSASSSLPVLAPEGSIYGSGGYLPGEFAFSAVGNEITYTYTVTNTSGVSLSDIKVNDDKLPEPACTILGTVASGDTASCSATYTITQADFDLGLVINTAQAVQGTYSSTFDDETVTYPLECIQDADGNDINGQKDLTMLCRATDYLDPVVITLNWDDTLMTGTNTADACALFDTDADGLVNYALCVIWELNAQQLPSSPVLYSCNDSKPDNCGGSVLIPDHNSVCTVDVTKDNPLIDGDQDAKAYCSIDLSDVGNTGAYLLDVCSYPSGSPTSVASDCVSIDPKKGNLSIYKDVVPDDAGTNWDISVTGPTLFSQTLTGDDTTGNHVVDPGTYIISETGGTGTDLANYDSTVQCTVNGVPGTVVLGTSITRTIGAGDVVTCEFTNTLKQGTITIIKNAVPDGGQNFEFALTGQTNFFLDDDLDATLPSSRSFTVTAGTYTAQEILPVTGWDLTNITCVDPDGGTTVNVGSGAATIDLDPNETVTCTYTNTQRGTITIVKDAVPNDAQDFAFALTGQTGFSLDDDSDAALPNSKSFTVPPGVYTATETLPVTGWDLTAIVCTDANSSGVVGTGVATINLEAGEVLTCTYTNTKRGTILIDKVTVPAGSATEFDFDPSWSETNFTLTDAGAPVSSGYLVPGSYSVTELAETGWDLTNVSCVSSIGDTELNTAIELDAGETVTCTFTNTQRGTILIDKVTVPTGSATVFDFDPSWSETNFTLTDAGAPVSSGYLVPGSYSVTELAETGWDLTNVSCVSSIGDTEVNTAIELDAGETVTCTFTNTQRGTILIDKVTVPTGSATVFDFDPSWSETNFTLTDAGAPVSSGYLVPGSYSVAELAETGWDLTNVSCVSSIGDTEVNTAIELDAGETVTCTFTNTQRGTITIVKDAVPNDAQDFNFTLTGQEPFVLDDDSDAALPSTRTFSVPPGEYTAVEAAVTDWDLTGLLCVDPTTDSTVDLASGTAVIDLSEGESVTCTYTNTQRGTITIVKDAVPDGAQDFAFTLTGQEPFALDDDADAALPNSLSFTVPPGEYTAVEPLVAGWDLTGLVCEDPTQDSQVTLSTGTAVIDLSAGESVTCTYTNTQRGTITIVKDAVPDDAQDFAFTLTGQTAFALDDDADAVLPNSRMFILPPGEYTAVEAAVWGWDLTGLECVDPTTDSTVDLASGTAVIDLAAGESVTCTYTNSKRGSLEVTKVVYWGQGDYDPDKTFTICIQGSSFPLGSEPGACLPIGADGGKLMWANLIPGLYSVEEEAQSGEWLVEYTGTPADVPAGGLASATVTNTNTAVTAVKLNYFKVEWVRGMQVKLAWATLTEIDNFGFEIHRSATNDFSEAILIGFVASQEPNSQIEQVYSFIDSSAPEQGLFYYWLVDVSNGGETTLEGEPTSGLAVRLFGNMIFLPAVQR